MTEILTESFCERCGTRYTFESATPRVRLQGVKVLSRGLKNFVLSDDTSLDEALASARNDSERELTSHQLDAFHKTFSFCMSCRQYTCPNCWNAAEARCLTCAPRPEEEVLPAQYPDLSSPSFLLAKMAPSAGTDGDAQAASSIENGHDASPPDRGSGVPPEWVTAAANEDAVAETESQGPARAEATDATGRFDHPTWHRELASVERPAPPASVPPTPPRTIGEKTAAQTGGLLSRFRPGPTPEATPSIVEGPPPAATTPEPTPSESVEPWPPLPDIFSRAEAEAEGAAVVDPWGSAEADALAEADQLSDPWAIVEAKAVAEPEAVAETETVLDPWVAATPATATEPEPAVDPWGATEADTPASVDGPWVTAMPATTTEADAPAEPEAIVDPWVPATPAATTEVESPAEPGPTVDPWVAAAPEAIAEPVAAQVTPDPWTATEPMTHADPWGAAEADALAERDDADMPWVASEAVVSAEPEAIAEPTAPSEPAVEVAPSTAEPVWERAVFAETDGIEDEPERVEPAVEPQDELPEREIFAESGATAEPEVVATSEPVPAPEPVAAAEVTIESVAAPAPVTTSEPVATPESVGASEVTTESDADHEAWVPLPDLDAERAESEIFDAAAPAAAAAELAEPAPAPSPVEAPASDHIQQPTWQIVAPDPSPTVEAEPAPATPGVAPSTDPQWPTRPAWLGGPAAQDMPLLGRPPAVQGGIDALWAASTNEVATGPSVPGKPVIAGVQPCISCGLSLSANARFCRRCGTPQRS